MLQKTTGIVLHSLKYSDTSTIVDIYTRHFGRVSFMVRMRKTKKASLKSAIFQPLTLLEIEMDHRPNSNLQYMREVKLLYPFKSVPFEPAKTAIALYLAEFLYRAVKEESENIPLFTYLQHSIVWLDEQSTGYTNFHLVFLMRLSRFLGIYPNLEDYSPGDYFDLRNASFTSQKPFHPDHIEEEEALRLSRIMRMNYDTMHLFKMSREDRNRCLEVINQYYRVHIPELPVLKSQSVLQELFG
ncbi:MAG: DNA repair protein RecO [Bacteroides sp.]|nr:DNA repair protein RecO [Bacteroides sp.]